LTTKHLKHLSNFESVENVRSSSAVEFAFELHHISTDVLQKRLLSDSEQNDAEKKDVKKKDGTVFAFLAVFILCVLTVQQSIQTAAFCNSCELVIFLFLTGYFSS